MQNVRSTKTRPNPVPPTVLLHGVRSVPATVSAGGSRTRFYIPSRERPPRLTYPSTAVADRHPTHLGFPPPPPSPSDQLAGASARVSPPPYVRPPPRQPGPPAPHPSPPRCRRGRPRRGPAAPLALAEAGRSRRRLAARGRRRGSTSG